MAAEIDQVSSPGDSGHECVGQACIVADQRVHGAVVVAIRMHVEQMRACAERCGDRGDHHGIPALGHVRHGLEEAHLPTLRAAVRRYRSITSLQRDLSTCRRCIEAGYPLESMPGRASRGGPACVPLRSGARCRRGSRGPALARTCRSAAPALAEPRRGQRSTTPSTAPLSLAAIRAVLSPAGATGPRPRRSGRSAHRGARRSYVFSSRQLVVTVGLLAARDLLGVQTMTECVGKSYAVGDAIVVPLPHPSGASGWLNEATKPRAAREGAHSRPARVRRPEPRRVIGTARRDRGMRRRIRA